MKRIYTHLRTTEKKSINYILLLAGAALSPLYWINGHFHRVPGVHIHLRILKNAFYIFLKDKNRIKKIAPNFVLPLDSVRYAEFDFFWQSFERKPPVGNYLDVSSPRLFPAMLLSKYSSLRATLVNPDIKDLTATRNLMEAVGYSERCFFQCRRIDEIASSIQRFDTISSISVVEHIPEGGDKRAVEIMWSLLRSGGRLLLSVPCAAEAFQEFMDFNEYKLYKADENGFVFSQQFYDESLLEEKIFKITGEPCRSSIYGEKVPGFSFKNREKKNLDPTYPFWRESLITGKNYRFYNSIPELPGWGVISMEFVKP